MSIDPSSISAKDLETCIRVLSKFKKNEGYLSLESVEYQRIEPLIKNLFHIGQRFKDECHRKQPIHKDKKTRKQNYLLRLGRVKQVQLENVILPDEIESSSTYTCYICKLEYETSHFFYDQLCPSCAKFNYEKRTQTTDLSNLIALVTEGRAKIGYRIILKLLRANCFVITITRFPLDLLHCLNKESDFDQWKDRVHIYTVDFRYSQWIEMFTRMLIEKYDKLDFLINNACQTNQQHEQLSISHSLLPDDQQKILNGNLQFALISNSIINQTTNSRVLRLDEISTNEINEVLTINTLAPFILSSKLKILMDDKHPNRESIKFIINVSTMESSFSCSSKTDLHPHINAAQAALNMMTRTSAIDYKQSNIYMVSVDAGRIDDQAMKAPLDDEDAAARILDPIIHTYEQLAQGKTDFHIPYGCFLKDYHICDW